MQEFFPSGDYSLIEGTTSDSPSIPRIMVPKQSNQNQSFLYPNLQSDKTYAIILNGGKNKENNFIRYWNDCAFIYQTLRNKYNIPKENIYPLMADGTDPAPDTKNKNTFISQNLDLDGDGIEDIQYAATAFNLQQVIWGITNKIKKDEQLFIYVMDHGSYSAPYCYINLWGNEVVSNPHFAEMLIPISQKGANISVVLGQCFSGGFTKYLEDVNCVIATACSEHESSYGADDVNFDEFVYWWTSAINGATPAGTVVNADTNNDGHISMEEAFLYAQSKDRENETPQYHSYPDYLGKNLSISYPVAEDCLVIRDFTTDYGIEPYWGNAATWESPDIWVRRTNDDIEIDDNITYTTALDSVYVYVRIHNYGKIDYSGGKYVHLNWALASTGLPMSVWKGIELYPGTNYPSGGDIDIVAIPPIPAGESVAIPIAWNLPNQLINTVIKPYTKMHFCFLARISDVSTSIPYDPSDEYTRVKESHGNAQKNMAFYRAAATPFSSHVMVRPEEFHLGGLSSSSLEIVPQSIDDLSIFADANVSIIIPQNTYDDWTLNGMTLNTATSLTNSHKMLANGTMSVVKKITFNNSNGKINNIRMGRSEAFPVEVDIELDSDVPYGRFYRIQLVQKDNDKIIGGESFFVYKEFPSGNPEIGVLTEDTPMGYTLRSPEVGEGVYNIWSDENDKEIAIGDSIEVIPTKSGQKYNLTTICSDETVLNGSVSLDAKLGFDSLFFSAESSTLNITVKEAVSNTDAQIFVSGTNSLDESLTFDFPKGETSITFNLPTMRSEVIIVSLVINGEMTETQKIIK